MPQREPIGNGFRCDRSVAPDAMRRRSRRVIGREMARRTLLDRRAGTWSNRSTARQEARDQGAMRWRLWLDAGPRRGDRARRRRRGAATRDPQDRGRRSDRLHRQGRAGLQPRAPIRHVLRRLLRDRRPADRLARLSRWTISISPIRSSWVLRCSRRFGAAGTYEISRRLEDGEPLSWPAVLGAVWSRTGKELGWLALVSLFTLIIWLDVAVFRLPDLLRRRTFHRLPQLFANVFTHDLRADVPPGRQRRRRDHRALRLFLHRRFAAAGRRPRHRFRDRDDDQRARGAGQSAPDAGLGDGDRRRTSRFRSSPFSSRSW